VYEEAPGFCLGPVCVRRHQVSPSPVSPCSCSPTETEAAGNPPLTRFTLSAEVSLVAAVSAAAESCRAATMSAAPKARVSVELMSLDVHHTMRCRAATTGSSRGEIQVPPYTRLYRDSTCRPIGSGLSIWVYNVPLM
jgi:hypothetical protein